MQEGNVGGRKAHLADGRGSRLGDLLGARVGRGEAVVEGEAVVTDGHHVAILADTLEEHVKCRSRWRRR